MLRTIALAGVTLAALLAASPASAQSRCTAPERPGWHSCLTAANRAIGDDGEMVRLTSVRPRLVIRYADGCPNGANRRTVAIRSGGERLARESVSGSCRRGVARYDVKLRLDLDLPAGTVVRSLWSGIPDAGAAPEVELKG
jgi:hypothetical protein